MDGETAPEGYVVEKCGESEANEEEQTVRIENVIFLN